MFSGGIERNQWCNDQLLNLLCDLAIAVVNVSLIRFDEMSDIARRRVIFTGCLNILYGSCVSVQSFFGFLMLTKQRRKKYKMNNISSKI